MQTKSIKKALSLILTLVMLCGLLGTTAFAAGNDSENENDNIITTATQLAAMTDGDYVLGANITIDASEWTPISNFTGTFNGAADSGYTITWSGTADVSEDYYAIFATNSGTIKNLKVTGTLTIKDGGNSDMDYISAVVAYNTGTINSVTNSASVGASLCYNVGGIAGYNTTTGKILNSANNGEVYGYARVGGIVGDNEGTVNSCSNSVQVKMTYNGKGGVGGIAGFNGDKNGANAAHIWNCYNTGVVISGTIGQTNTQGSWVGGITGFNNAKSNCVNCFNTGYVYGYAYLDHIAGNNEGSVVNCYGWDGHDDDDDDVDIDVDGYDGAMPVNIAQLAGTAMTSGDKKLVDLLNTGASGFWTQGTDYPVLNNAATTTSGDPSNASSDYTVVMYTNPRTLYVAGQTFNYDNAMEVRVVYTDNTYTVLNSDYYSWDHPCALTVNDSGDTVTVTVVYNNVTYTFEFTITVFAETITVVLDPTRTVEGSYATYAGAVGSAGEGGIVQIASTVSLASGDYFDNVTFTPYGNFDGPLFEVTSGTVTLAGSSMVLNGGGTATLVKVTGGTLVLRGGVTLQNCGTAVDVQSGGAVTVNKATITVLDPNDEDDTDTTGKYSIKVADSTSTFTLEDYGGTEITGTVYLGDDAYIAANAAIPCNISVEVPADTDVAIVVTGTDSYTLSGDDQTHISCSGYDVNLLIDEDEETSVIYVTISEE